MKIPAPTIAAFLFAALAQLIVAASALGISAPEVGRFPRDPDDELGVLDQPGLALPAAKWLAEDHHVVAIGGDVHTRAKGG